MVRSAPGGLSRYANDIRRIILEQSRRARVGHIGSALSIADLVAALYGGILHIPALDDPERDRFILSKGHAALAVYAALQLNGWISSEDLDTFCGDGSSLGVHPEHELPGIEFSTGSLGHGLSIAAGGALAARLQQSSRRVFTIVSDAECNEGSIWEAAMFAAHHRLSNLYAIIDANGQQALGATREILDLSPMEERWRAFGWDVTVIDGHGCDALVEAFDESRLDPARPHAFIATTTFGKGVSFMERQLKWHYWPMSDEEFDRAVAEVDARA